jgi:hypothetical protein
VELFLDRYALPRIARLIAPSKASTNYDEKVNQSSSATGAKSSNKKSTNHGQYQPAMPINVCSDTQTATTGQDDNCGGNNNGELFLLYRHLKKYKVYHAINGKTSGTNRKKGIKIPQDFTGELAIRRRLKTIFIHRLSFADTCSHKATTTTKMLMLSHTLIH